jgi:hypothetical protein
VSWPEIVGMCVVAIVSYIGGFITGSSWRIGRKPRTDKEGHA